MCVAKSYRQCYLQRAIPASFRVVTGYSIVTAGVTVLLKHKADHRVVYHLVKHRFGREIRYGKLERYQYAIPPPHVQRGLPHTYTRIVVIACISIFASRKHAIVPSCVKSLPKLLVSYC
jgi:hypothetical protein